MHRIAAFALLLAVAFPAFPCTTFCLTGDGAALFGRNYDFEIGQGYVMTNRRGVVKTSTAGSLQWSSRYGSVTLNQWGREFPMDGINEAGLVIALMWLDGTVYPARDERPALGVLEWIQYALDNYGSVGELLTRIEETRVAGGTPLHYLVADATGDVATIEYLQGRLVVHRGAALTAAALANDSYARSMSYLQQFSGFGGSRSAPQGASSLDRFARASIEARTAPRTVDGAFGILASVAQPQSTRWSVVYDAARRELHWVSDRSAERKSVRLAALPFGCTAEGKMLDVHSTFSGDVTGQLETYDAALNRALVLSSYATTSFTRNQPQRYAEADAAHAEAFRCETRRRSVRN